MKNSLIFLSVLVVTILAAIDIKDRISELDSIAVKTPAQVEMNKDMLKPTRDAGRNMLNPSVPTPRNQSNLFNEHIKQQQNNNLPQSKQNNPLNN